MAIEITQKRKEKKESNSIVLFLSFFLLILFLGAYGYLFISSRNIKEEISEKNSQIGAILSERKEIEDEVLRHKKNIADFKKVFEEHKNVVRVFSVVENLSHPYVWFPAFNFEVETGKANLSGMARDFTSLGQQIMILKNIPGLRGVNVSGIQAIDNGVSFSLSFSIDPQTLK
ncbi:MAG: hypothetical protein PHH17_03005 [Candidatus Pacebacteria bacterium]|jgi:hypothetical protein|nr:hypothetical protein [Candidatus Paceibacterota bacterium]MDD3072632.1 hypothetical protein [Candidatus Paceibacterota bacterium]MDD3729323.1 hypothetical protein [Candidatus Paceibacterota bacterium]MDD4201678.1 hypothetical protein [Candidatus Paceibacterota bacterium]MDD4467026.1 hypothetical protein [Candidatus Paceibacterota bacterium]